jgi:DnaJ-class molecular chaperone
MKKKTIYHAYACKSVTVSKVSCRRCRGVGFTSSDDGKCTHCNGHGEYWSDGSGNCFKKYTLEPFYS